MRHTLNTIVEGFFEGKEINYSRRRYTPKSLTIESLPMNPDSRNKEAQKYEITFLEKDTASIHPHHNDHMVIIVQCDKLEGVD